MTTEEAIKEVIICMPDTEAREIAIEALEKVENYKDLEEQGLLLRLPCKVGDTVYRVSIIGRDLNGKPYYKIKEKSFAFVWLEKLGKTVFLTREEAEAKLKELGENG